jgi:hypothetical protein
MNHAGRGGICIVDGTMQCQRLAGLVSALLHAVERNFGQTFRFEKTKTRVSGCDQKAIG